MALPRGLGSWLLGPHLAADISAGAASDALYDWPGRLRRAGTGLHALGSAQRSLRAMVLGSAFVLACSLGGAVGGGAMGTLMGTGRFDVGYHTAVVVATARSSPGKHGLGRPGLAQAAPTGGATSHAGGSATGGCRLVHKHGYPRRTPSGSSPSLKIRKFRSRKAGYSVKVLLSAFQCVPGQGSELGNGWHWATALADLGCEVTVVTSAYYRDQVLATDTRGIEFRFVDLPTSPLRRFPSRLWTYDIYMRWQDAALKHLEAQPQRYTWSTMWDGDPCTWAASYGGCRRRSTARSAAAKQVLPTTGVISAVNGQPRHSGPYRLDRCSP